MRDVLLITDERMLAHDPGPVHPETPDRLRAILRELRSNPVPGTRWSAPAPAPREAVERVHDAPYVESILALRGERADLDADTSTSPDSIDAALLAAGAGITAVDALFAGEADAAFALIRPPGHHAERGRAMGFCFFNNIAIAAAHARARHACERVLIVDWDVHHGNGTQHAFERDPSVLFFSTHQFPFYPGTGAPTEIGEGEGRGRTVNVPIPAGCGDGDYSAVFDRVLAPIAGAFKPDLVLVSAGFDAHWGDPLGEMRVTTAGFARLCAVTRDIAARHARGRIALLLEGGYDVESLAADVRACTEMLAGADAAPIPHSQTGATIADKVHAIHARFWPALQ